ncbi:hypothetical protein [Salipaludibacillus daqingensis]|uniref:hypothetical protein n=1 Tax=Salipaludibacillus daqingensis TaxID=3041001 RepID=UPI0024745D63|nr:hypothetical protein [Salipaludibacillus daqingensis]
MRRVLVVCSGGLGTSVILKVELKKIFKEWNIPVYIEQSDVSAVGFSNAEMIIGAKQIISSLPSQQSVALIPLTYIADSAHIRNTLLENDALREWLDDV